MPTSGAGMVALASWANKLGRLFVTTGNLGPTIM